MACCKFKTGQKVRVNLPGNAYHGQVFVLGNEYVSNPHGWYTTTNLLFYDTQLVPTACDRASIKDEIERVKKEMIDLNKQVDVYEKQLAYLDETNQEAFEEVEFKAYYALKVLEQANMTTIDRAKAIADLVNMTR